MTDWTKHKNFKTTLFFIRIEHGRTQERVFQNKKANARLFSGRRARKWRSWWFQRKNWFVYGFNTNVTISHAASHQFTMESEIFIMTWYLTWYLVEYRVNSWSCGTCAPLCLLGLMMCQWWTLFFVEVASIVTLRTDLGVGYMYWWLRAKMVRGLPMILWTDHKQSTIRQNPWVVILFRFLQPLTSTEAPTHGSAYDNGIVLVKLGSPREHFFNADVDNPCQGSKTPRNDKPNSI